MAQVETDMNHFSRVSESVREWRTHHSLWSHLAAPVWLRVKPGHRWRIASWLNKSRRYCWADLVDLALTGRDGDDLCDTHVPRLPEQQPACARECRTFGHSGEHACSCYCGKFRFVAPHGLMTRQF